MHAHAQDRLSLASGPLPARIVVTSCVRPYREGLAASLTRDGRLKVVKTVDEREIPPAIVEMRPDAVVLDASSLQGLALARELKCAHPTLPVIGLGISDSPADVVGCAEAGLAGFIGQDGSLDALVETVTDAIRGEFRCPPHFASILCARLARLAGSGGREPSSLTPRELEIAGMVAEGLSNKEIAKDLNIGPTTVKNHVHNILDKLNVRRRAAIASRVTEAAR